MATLLVNEMKNGNRDDVKKHDCGLLIGTKRGADAVMHVRWKTRIDLKVATA